MKLRNNHSNEISIKYFGDINGKLGVATKRIYFRDDLNYTNVKIDPNKGCRSLSICKDIKKNETKWVNKEPLPNFKKEKIVIFSDSFDDLKGIQDDFYKSKQMWNTTTKNFRKSQNKDELKSVSINQNIIENINFELTNMNHVKKERPFSQSFKISSFNEILKKSNKNLPLLKGLVKKEKSTCDSEMLNPNRYRKPKINLEELLINHNAILRKDMKSNKINDYHLKYAVNQNSSIVSHGIKLPENKQFFEKSSQMNNKFIKKALNIINMKNV